MKPIRNYDPSKKANKRKKPHPWGAWAPGWLRNNGRKEWAMADMNPNYYSHGAGVSGE